MGMLVRHLWDDDRGAVISVELVLIVAILIFGLIPGLVAFRNSANAALASMSNLISVIIPSFSFSSLTINGSPATVAVVLPGSLGNGNLVEGTQVAPNSVPFDAVVVSPAP